MKTSTAYIAVGIATLLTVVAIRSAANEMPPAGEGGNVVIRTSPEKYDAPARPEVVAVAALGPRTEVPASLVSTVVNPSAARARRPARETPAIVARAVAPGRLTLQTGSRLWLDGKSTVKDFTCKAETLEAAVVTSRPDAATAIVAGERAVTSVELRVPVVEIDCDNGTMNGHLRDALEAKKHPVIVFTLATYALARADSGTAVTLAGALTIRGQSEPVSLLVQATRVASGAMRLTGNYELNMKDFGVKPPSLMLGTMKVREKVKVRFDLLLKD